MTSFFNRFYGDGNDDPYTDARLLAAQEDLAERAARRRLAGLGAPVAPPLPNPAYSNDARLNAAQAQLRAAAERRRLAGIGAPAAPALPGLIPRAPILPGALARQPTAMELELANARNNLRLPGAPMAPALPGSYVRQPTAMELELANARGNLRAPRAPALPPSPYDVPLPPGAISGRELTPMEVELANARNRLRAPSSYTYAKQSARPIVPAPKPAKAVEIIQTSAPSLIDGQLYRQSVLKLGVGAVGLASTVAAFSTFNVLARDNDDARKVRIFVNVALTIGAIVIGAVVVREIVRMRQLDRAKSLGLAAASV